MDAMVTARMPQSKKEAGALVLKELGMTASQLINEVYDRLIATRSNPLAERGAKTEEQLYAEAEAWADSFPYVELGDELKDLDIKQIRALRVVDRYGDVFVEGDGV